MKNIVYNMDKLFYENFKERGGKLTSSEQIMKNCENDMKAILGQASLEELAKENKDVLYKKEIEDEILALVSQLKQLQKQSSSLKRSKGYPRHKGQIEHNNEIKFKKMNIRKQIEEIKLKIQELNDELCASNSFNC